jgi:hypothetical protein
MEVQRQTDDDRFEFVFFGIFEEVAEIIVDVDAFPGLLDGIPTIDGEQTGSGFESGGRGNVAVKSAMQIIGSNIGDCPNFDVFRIDGSHENLPLISATDDSDADGIAMSEPIAGVKTCDGNGRDGSGEESAFEKTASGTFA